jgi:hypothetical protein
MTTLAQPSYQHPPAVAGAPWTNSPSRDAAAMPAKLTLDTIMKGVSLSHFKFLCHCRITVMVTLGVDLVFKLILS